MFLWPAFLDSTSRCSPTSWYYKSDQGSFVKKVALPFLDDIRPPVRKAAAQSVVLLSAQSKSNGNTVGLTHNVAFSNKTMHQILNKLLSIAVSDPDEEVREIMLGSLSRNFDSYLKNKSSMQCLILALNDSNDKVQRKAIILLKRLIFTNASDVVPALQNSLYRILRIVNMKTYDNEKDVIQNLKLLKCFLNNAAFLLKNQEDLIFRFLLSSLQHEKTIPTISSELFSTLSCLVIVARKVTMKYFDPLMQVTLSSFTDLTFTAKRVEAIKCLTSIIRSTG